ncbi:MAG TPA: MFS transporter [Chloroflexota bacterium]|nr:MFS transporter [Chloroflexota bacterium]
MQQRRAAGALSVEFLLSTYLPALVLALGTGIALPALPILAKSFHVSFGVASLVITIFLLGGMIGSLPTGALIDLLGSRTVMLAGPIITATMAVLVMTAHSFPELLVFRFIDGWSAQLWLMGRITSISALSASRQRGRQINWMMGMDNLGKLCGPVAGGLIAGIWGPRSPFGAYAILALLALVPMLVLVKQGNPRPVRRPKGTRVPGEWREGLRRVIRPRVIFFAVAFFGAVARSPVNSGLLHLYATYTYNLDVRAIGLLATAGSCILVPIGFFAGYLMDRIGRRLTIAPGYASFAVAMACIALTAFVHLSLWWYVAGYFLVVASQGLTVGSTQAIGADIAPEEGRGTFYGYWQTINQLGTTSSPFIFAFLANAIGYGSSFILLAAASALAGGLLLLAHEPSKPLPSAATTSAALLDAAPAVAGP